MPDPSLIDAAVLNVLSSDAALLALCPDGVYWDVARAGATKFVVVSLSDHFDVTGLNDEDLYERHVYLVKVVANVTGGTLARDAAARIHQLLHRAAIDLTTAGYTLMDARRIERVRYTELDPVERTSHWQHRGGLYELMASPN